MILCGGFCEPLYSFFLVFGHSESITVHDTETILSFGLTLGSGFLIQFLCLCVIPFYSVSFFIYDTEIVLCV